MVCGEDAAGSRGAAALSTVYASQFLSSASDSHSVCVVHSITSVKRLFDIDYRMFGCANGVGVDVGTFLVRQSTSQAGSFALSIKTNHGPRHCQIIQASAVIVTQREEGRGIPDAPAPLNGLRCCQDMRAGLLSLYITGKVTALPAD